MAKHKTIENVPVVSRTVQVKQINELFKGATVKAVKEENSLVTIEFDTVGIIIFANPSAIGLGLYDPPEGEQPNV